MKRRGFLKSLLGLAAATQVGCKPETIENPYDEVINKIHEIDAEQKRRKGYIEIIKSAEYRATDSQVPIMVYHDGQELYRVVPDPADI